jgi:VWFA-related protein
MKHVRWIFWTALLFGFPAFSAAWGQSQNLAGQGQQAPSGTPTIRLNSTLVFLDVTVLDKKGRPVVTGLTKDDFTITEDKKPQRIFSFEAPETHVMAKNRAGENPDGQAPATIFVLDLLNSSFSDFAYIRYSVKKYLDAQPSQLNSPAELMVIGNESLELLQGFTTNKNDLLYALDHLPAVLPYKQMNRSFFTERFGQSIDALQQIALENKGIPGRKNIVWVGHGGPGLNTTLLPDEWTAEVEQYVHAVANMLVDARISLFVIYPGLPVKDAHISLSAMDADVRIGDADPFSGDINFGVFVDDTGGKLFYNRNDVDMEMKRSQELGSEYYTLTYQPHDVGDDGKFRRIRVTLRNPELRVVTKAAITLPTKTCRPSAGRVR